MTAAAATGLLLFTLFVLAPRLESKFMPKEDRNQLIVNLEYPPGTSLAASSRRSAALEERVRAIPGVAAVYSVVGDQQDPRLVRWRVNLVDKNARPEGAEAFKTRIRAILAGDDGLRTRAVLDPPTIEGLGDWAPIVMYVTGRDFAQLRSEADLLVAAMRQIPAITDIQLKDSPRQAGAPASTSTGRRRPGWACRRARWRSQVRLATQGEVAGKLREGRRQSEIRVRLAEEDRSSAAALGAIWIGTPRGPVGLSQLARLRQATSPAVVEHQRRERQHLGLGPDRPRPRPGHGGAGAARAARRHASCRPATPTSGTACRRSRPTRSRPWGWRC